MKLQNLFLQACCILVVLSLVAAESNAQTATQTDKRMTPELLWKLGRLGDAVSSPDGKQVAYTVRRYELAEDKGTSSLNLLNLESGESKVLLDKWSSLGSLQWIEKGGKSRIFFEGLPPAKDETEDEQDAKADDDADDKPTTQAWTINPGNGEQKQVTDVKDGIANMKVSPDGNKLAFTVDVKMA